MTNLLGMHCMDMDMITLDIGLLIIFILLTYLRLWYGLELRDEIGLDGLILNIIAGQARIVQMMLKLKVFFALSLSNETRMTLLFAYPPLTLFFTR